MQTLRYDWLKPSFLKGIKRGLEKESLRLDSSGKIAKTVHPEGLGSALAHPYITTDYSEALLEFITPPFLTISDALNHLKQTHQYVYSHIGEELLWPLSMPCMIGNQDQDIPLAQYGSSNLGQFKTLYRHGLGIRYGRKMQTIAGLHYNISYPDELFSAWQQHEQDFSCHLQDFKNKKYLGMIRNIKRLLPMKLYLLGASPMVCACFLYGRNHHLTHLNTQNLYLPYATSLRMGKLGYHNSVQDQLGIEYNDLEQYLTRLDAATKTIEPQFQAAGIDDAEGTPQQINANVLQIENEFYSPVRPKQALQGTESTSQALKKRGIGYIELRAIDVDPFSPIGIKPETAHFIEVFALYCLLLESPYLYEAENTMLNDNIEDVVNQGRDPTCTIQLPEGEMVFLEWIQHHTSGLIEIAKLLDQEGSSKYQDALQFILPRVTNANLCPSAQLLSAIEHSTGHIEFGLSLAQDYKDSLLAEELKQEVLAEYIALRDASVTQQIQIEASDTISFKSYLAPYRPKQE